MVRMHKKHIIKYFHFKKKSCKFKRYLHLHYTALSYTCINQSLRKLIYKVDLRVSKITNKLIWYKL